jgi:2-keto-4-pentenoate hydratase/2-oxohepta-3-ene-1,7-dioic acid hydratase in catechol pathway
MKLVKFQRNGQFAEGIVDGDRVRVLGSWYSSPLGDAPFTLPTRAASDLESMRNTSTESVAIASIRLLPPIDPARKIICVGVNYRDHAGEIKFDEPKNPILFTRSLDSIVGHESPIIRPRVSETLDFEGEIAVVIGRRGRHIAPGAALDHVGFYSCFMDGSVREYQRHALTTGKNFWRSGSFGPWLVPSTDVRSEDLRLVTRVNGETVQSAHAGQMIFDISSVVSYCSRWTWLEPGDVIAMGTPGGVGSRRTPPQWLKPGDVVEVEVEPVGRLRNNVLAEEQARDV